MYQVELATTFTTVSMEGTKGESRCYVCENSCVDTLIYVKQVLVQPGGVDIITLYLCVDYCHGYTSSSLIR